MHPTKSAHTITSICFRKSWKQKQEFFPKLMAFRSDSGQKGSTNYKIQVIQSDLLIPLVGGHLTFERVT